MGDDRLYVHGAKAAASQYDMRDWNDEFKDLCIYIDPLVYGSRYSCMIYTPRMLQNLHETVQEHWIKVEHADLVRMVDFISAAIPNRSMPWYMGRIALVKCTELWDSIYSNAILVS